MGPAAAQPPQLAAHGLDESGSFRDSGTGVFEDSYTAQGGFAELKAQPLSEASTPRRKHQTERGKLGREDGLFEEAPPGDSVVIDTVTAENGSSSARRRFEWRLALRKLGPAFLISIGYMDPGNWATDIEGGSRFGYRLLWVLVVSNVMAWLLQTLASRLGIVTGRHLAQLCREAYPRIIAMTLFALAETAIIATDLAEVIGTAVGLNLVLGIPLLLGILVTTLDTLLLLMAQRAGGLRRIEQIVLSLLFVITICFALELVLSKPSFIQMIGGLVPRIDGQSLLVALGILGATVMPHNFYLHSAIVIRDATVRRPADSCVSTSATRTADGTAHNGHDLAGCTDDSDRGRELECVYSAIDCAVALNAAFFINAAILITAASSFWANHVQVATLQEAHALLERVLPIRLWGRVEVAPLVFGIALIAAGQSSTITGTLAGQYVMEGFLGLSLQMWQQRLLTRLCAVVPSVLVIILLGPESTYRLLILSQVVLSLQLPFAIVPMIRFTGSKALMGERFASGMWTRICAWCAAAFIIVLNLWMAGSMLFDAFRVQSGRTAGAVVGGVLAVPLTIYLLGVLFWLCMYRGFRNE
jgi:manganese transport protein